MTHFACADDPDNDYSDRQLDRFNAMRKRLPEAPTTIGNSAGAMRGAPYAGDLVRIGISLFGGDPSLAGGQAMKDVVLVQSKILQVRTLDQETPVGYGSSYTAPAGSRIATVGIGYADGYPWSLSNRGIVAIGAHRAPVVGRVSMDLIMVDVSALPDEATKPGTLVDLISPRVPLEEVAERAGTLNYEILTGLGQRARRHYLGGP